jgi:hypothetical protein
MSLIYFSLFCFICNVNFMLCVCRHMFSAGEGGVNRSQLDASLSILKGSLLHL